MTNPAAIYLNPVEKDPIKQNSVIRQLIECEAAGIFYWPINGTSVSSAIATLQTNGGGTIYIPGGQDPALPADYHNVAIVYDGPRILFSNQTEVSTSYAQRLVRTQDIGTHVGEIHVGFGSETQGTGGGINGPANGNVGIQVGAYKTNWQGTRAGLAPGEIDGLDIYVRNTGPDVSQALQYSTSTSSGGSDTNGLSANIQSRGSCGSAIAIEAVASNVNDDFTLHKEIDVQLCAVTRVTDLDATYGIVVGANFGSAQSGIQIQANSTSATFVNGVDLTNGSFTGAPIIAPQMTVSATVSTGKTGAIKWDANFIYICTASDFWKRASLTSF